MNNKDLREKHVLFFIKDIFLNILYLLVNLLISFVALNEHFTPVFLLIFVLKVDFELKNRF